MVDVVLHLSYHGQLLSLAVQVGVAIEIERAIKKNASFYSAHGALETLAPGPPAGVLNSGIMGVNQRTSSECVPRAASLAC